MIGLISVSFIAKCGLNPGSNTLTRRLHGALQKSEKTRHLVGSCFTFLWHDFGPTNQCPVKRNWNVNSKQLCRPKRKTAFYFHQSYNLLYIQHQPQTKVIMCRLLHLVISMSRPIYWGLLDQM